MPPYNERQPHFSSILYDTSGNAVRNHNSGLLTVSHFGNHPHVPPSFLGNAKYAYPVEKEYDVTPTQEQTDFGYLLVNSWISDLFIGVHTVNSDVGTNI